MFAMESFFILILVATSVQSYKKISFKLVGDHSLPKDFKQNGVNSFGNPHPAQIPIFRGPEGKPYLDYHSAYRIGGQSLTNGGGPGQSGAHFPVDPHHPFQGEFDNAPSFGSAPIDPHGPCCKGGLSGKENKFPGQEFLGNQDIGLKEEPLGFGVKSPSHFADISSPQFLGHNSGFHTNSGASALLGYSTGITGTITLDPKLLFHGHHPYYGASGFGNNGFGNNGFGNNGFGNNGFGKSGVIHGKLYYRVHSPVNYDPYYNGYAWKRK